MVISKIVLASKLTHVFRSKSFVSNWLRFPKSASRFSVKVLASKRFHLAKSWFCGKGYFLQNQVCKIGFKIFSKSFGKFGSGFFSQVRFFWQGHFFVKLVFSKGFGKSSALAFCKFKVDSVGKVGLVKNYGACKIKSIKARFCFLAASLPKVGHTNKACT